jgi:hypothetical protein
LPSAGGLAVPLFLVPSVAGLRHLSGSAPQPRKATGPAVWPDTTTKQPTTDPIAIRVANAAGGAAAVGALVPDPLRLPVAAAAAASAAASAANAARSIATGAAAAAAAAAPHDARVQDLRAIATNLT